MRLMENGWTDQLSHIVKDAIIKRVTEGQATNTIKFEQLYSDVIDKARGKSEYNSEFSCSLNKCFFFDNI